MRSIERTYRHGGWWDEINWSQVERDVRRLQGRIYRAGTLGLSRVRGNSHARFLEGKGLVITPSYSTVVLFYTYFRPPPPLFVDGRRSIKDFCFILLSFYAFITINFLFIDLL